MLTLLFLIYVVNRIRSLLSGKLVSHVLSCGGDDDNEAEDKYNAAIQPVQAYQNQMNELFNSVYVPYVQDQSSLWQTYGKPIAEGQLKTYQDVGLPAYRSLGEKLTGDLNTPWNESEMKGVFDKIWQQTREKTAAEYAPITERMSQKLAGSGALDTGAAIKAYGDIQQSKYKSLENQAIEQALQEYNVKNQAKQQSYSNMSSYLNYQPTANTSAISGIGNYQPEVIAPYVDQTQGNWITGSKSGWEKTFSDLAFGQNQEQAMQMAMIGAMMMSSKRYKKNIKLWEKH